MIRLFPVFLAAALISPLSHLALAQTPNSYGYEGKYPYYGLPEQYQPLPETFYRYSELDYPTTFPHTPPQHSPRDFLPNGPGSLNPYALGLHTYRAAAPAEEPGADLNSPLYFPRNEPLFGPGEYERALATPASNLVPRMTSLPATRPATRPTTRPGIATRQPSSDWTGMRQIVGTITTTRTVRYGKDSPEHLIASIQGPDKTLYTADLGPTSIRDWVTLNPGDEIRVFGHTGLIDGKPALFAQVLRTQTQSFTIRQTAPVEVPATQPSGNK